MLSLAQGRSMHLQRGAGRPRPGFWWIASSTRFHPSSRGNPNIRPRAAGSTLFFVVPTFLYSLYFVLRATEDFHNHRSADVVGSHSGTHPIQHAEILDGAMDYRT